MRTSWGREVGVVFAGLLSGTPAPAENGETRWVERPGTHQGRPSEAGMAGGRRAAPEAYPSPSASVSTHARSSVVE